jgi:hypothetical protein
MAQENTSNKRNGQKTELSAKEKQIEKRNQEMARRKAEAEAREQALKAKKKKRLIIAVVAAVLVVAIVCGITIPLVIAQRNKYIKVNFKTLAVPTSVAEAQKLTQYNHRNVEMEGYAFPCGTNRYYVLCKEEVQSCPYVTGQVPDNGVRMEMKDGSRFDAYYNTRVRIRGRLEINTVAVEKFEGLETYMYLVIDKIEEIEQ